MSNESSSAKGGSSAVGTLEMDPEYRTINLLGLAHAALARRFVVLKFSLAGLAIGIIAAYAIRPKYDAEVRFLPPAQKELSPISLFPAAQGKGDHYLGLVSSRTVADDVIEHQHLAEYFHTRRPSETRRRLNGITKIVTDKDQFITVTVRAAEPEAAMRIANEYVDALYRLNRSIALSEAKQRWEYYEGPLEEEKNNLAAAEEELKQAQQRTGMVLPEAQVRLGVSAISEMKQEISTREAQLAALLTGSTEQNPQVIRLRSQIESLRAEVARMEQQEGGAKGSSPSNAHVPELTLEVMRRTRDVKFHETLFEILAKQYENARVGESYSPPVEVVDRAVLPDEKSWPPRKVFMILGLACGGLFGLMLVCLQAAELPRRWKEALLHGHPAAKADASSI